MGSHYIVEAELQGFPMYDAGTLGAITVPGSVCIKRSFGQVGWFAGF